MSEPQVHKAFRDCLELLARVEPKARPAILALREQPAPLAQLDRWGHKEFKAWLDRRVFRDLVDSRSKGSGIRLAITLQMTRSLQVVRPGWQKEQILGSH